jgi:hypothetical protein
VWDDSLVGNMEGVNLSPTAAAGEPLLKSMKSEVEAAWEEHAAKKSKLSSPETTPSAPEKVKAFTALIQIVAIVEHYL